MALLLLGVDDLVDPKKAPTLKNIDPKISTKGVKTVVFREGHNTTVLTSVHEQS